MALTGEAKREYQRLWMQRRRAAFFEDKTCVKCGAVKDLELDHVDPATKVTHKVWSWSENRRNEELAKCQVLCRVCHLAKTKDQISKPPVCGTTSNYYRGCRCGLCKRAIADYKQRYRAGLAR